MLLTPSSIRQQIDELSHLRKLSEDATTPLEKELKNLQNKVASIRAQLLAADTKITELEKTIEGQELNLNEHFKTLSLRVRDYYKYARSASPLLTILASSNTTESFATIIVSVSRS